MPNDKYLNYAIDLICRNFEVAREDLMGRKKSEEVVNARCALVHILVFEGVETNVIERWTGIAANSQSYLLQNFELKAKSSPWFRHQMVSVIKDAKETCPIAFYAHDRDGNVVFYPSKFE